jgi:hypothetical protein
MGKHGAFGFSQLEHRIIQLRTNGHNITAMSERLGIPKTTIHRSLWAIYRKVGVNDIALLTRWAMATGLDEALPPETEETREIKRPKVFKKRIKLGRLRRARIRYLG